MKKATLAIYEAFVLRQFLSNYPSKRSYCAILKLIQKESYQVQKEHYQVSIRQPFEHHHPEDVIQYMEDLKESLIREFVPREVA